MNRLERNRQQAVLIVSRIERNLELSRCARVGQFIRAGQESKWSFQRLIRDFQPKRRFPMYSPPVCNEYIPFDYPEVEFVPDFEPVLEPFQWNPVPTILAPDMSKGEYNMRLARDAFQFGIMPVDMNHD